MAALATDADLKARLGRDLTEAETARSAALLADASALIRGYTKQDFGPGTDVQVVLRPVGSYLRLPQGPVTAVTSVVVAPGAAGPGAAWSAPSFGWRWDGVDRIAVSSNGCPGAYKVTYSHAGEVPADVVAVCCRMVLAALLAPTMAEGLVRSASASIRTSTGSRPAPVRPGRRCG